MAFNNATAIVKISIPSLDSLLCDDVRHEHCAVKVEDMFARGHAAKRELLPIAVITKTSGFPTRGNEMHSPAPVAGDPILHCHFAIMLPQDVALPRDATHLSSITLPSRAYA